MTKINHKNVINELETIGFTNHEASLYLEILHSGEASVGMLLQQVKLHREQAYRALQHLEDMGFVRQYEKYKRAYFSVTDTELFVERVKEKYETAQSLQKRLKAIHKRSPHIVSVSEGVESFEVLFENILKSTKKNGEYLILGGQGKGFESLPGVWSMYKKYIKIFTKRNIKLRMIAFEGQDFTNQFKIQFLLEVRELPGKYLGPVATVIFSNKVALEVMDPENISIVTIENKKIADSYLEQFEALWKLAKTVKRI